jgi:hypothetical protein
MSFELCDFLASELCGFDWIWKGIMHFSDIFMSKNGIYRSSTKYLQVFYVIINDTFWFTGLLQFPGNNHIF